MASPIDMFRADAMKVRDSWQAAMTKRAETERVQTEQLGVSQEAAKRKRGYMGTLNSGPLGVIGMGDSSLSRRTLIGL